jgi:hypothetical protein
MKKLTTKYVCSECGNVSPTWLGKCFTCGKFGTYVEEIVEQGIGAEKQLNIKTKYIYGSRSVWRVVTERNYSQFIKHIFDEYREKILDALRNYAGKITMKSVPQLMRIRAADQEKTDELLDLWKKNGKLTDAASVKIKGEGA